MDDDSRAASPSVDRALTVLEILVNAEEPLTLTALAKTANIPLATCASIAYTLEQRGYAARRIVGRSHFWRPTLRLYSLAAGLVRKVDLPSLVRTELQNLADEMAMPAHIGILEGTSVVYVAKASAPGFIQFDTYVGKIAPFDLTALGRAIAAYLPGDELEPLLSRLSQGKGPKAERPGVMPFMSVVNEVRKKGYAVEDEEEEAGIACVAAPFFDAEGRVAGSIGVTGLARDLVGARRRQAVDGVRKLGREMTLRLGYVARPAW